MSDLQKLLETIFRKSYSKRRIRLEDAIFEVAPQVLGGDSGRIEAYARRMKSRIWNELVKRLEVEKKKGLFPTFEIIDHNRFEMLQM